MALAITALDVAFVSAIAALVSAVVAPLSTWLVARGGWANDRRLGSDERIFEKRALLYEEIIRDGKKDLRSFRATVDSTESAFLSVVESDPDDDSTELAGPEVPDPGVLGTPTQWDELEARIRVIASDKVVEKHEAFRHAMALAINHARESLGKGRMDFVDQRARFDEAERRLEGLAQVMRADLAGERKAERHVGWRWRYVGWRWRRVISRLRVF